jgi:ribonuclease PH
MTRPDGRADDELRSITFERDYTEMAAGSCLVSFGKTRVLCTASIDDNVPRWMQRTGKGWVTAEYSMLPGATAPRGRRDPGGRGKEIQRLVGRSLRAAVDLGRLVGRDGAVSIVCDCDVIDADGGTRTAAITGSFVALSLALRRLVQEGRLPAVPVLAPVAAVSVGIVPVGGRGVPMLDLCYEEDVAAHVDLNVVSLRERGLVEVQGTAEKGSFSRDELTAMLDLAAAGIEQLHAVQAAALESAG